MGRRKILNRDDFDLKSFTHAQFHTGPDCPCVCVVVVVGEGVLCL